MAGGGGSARPARHRFNRLSGVKIAAHRKNTISEATMDALFGFCVMDDLQGPVAGSRGGRCGVKIRILDHAGFVNLSSPGTSPQAPVRVWMKIESGR